MPGTVVTSTVDVPGNLQRLHTDGKSAIPPGGVTAEDTVLLTGSVWNSTWLPYALEVEVKPTTAAFDGSSTIVGAYVQNGATARAVLSPGAGSFHWRARPPKYLPGGAGWGHLK